MNPRSPRNWGENGQSREIGRGRRHGHREGRLEKDGRRAAVVGAAMVAGGTVETAVAGTGIVAGTTVRYAGEMGAGGKTAESAAKLAKEAALAEKIAKSEARSGISRETVYANAALGDAERLAKTEEVLGRKLPDSQREALLKAHNTGEHGVYETLPSELLAKARVLEAAGFSNAEREAIVRNGLAGNPTSLAEYARSKGSNLQEYIRENFYLPNLKTKLREYRTDNAETAFIRRELISEGKKIIERLEKTEGTHTTQ